MGCDIHLCLEYKSKGGHWWEGLITDATMGRNYSVFALLAGVRGKEKPLVDPRGKPECMSIWTRLEMEDLDAHSHTWLTPNEFEQATKQGGLPYIGLLSAARALEAEDCEVRFVLCFDN